MERPRLRLMAPATLGAMPEDPPPTISSSGGRLFATYPAAVVVPIVNDREELLLLESPRRPGWWEPVNGAVDAAETVLEAALREVHEEAGPDLQVRPLGVVHASMFAYDALVSHVISVTYLMAHEAGEVVPGDDMHGSKVRWAGLAEIEAERLRLVPPLDQAWLRRRAIDVYRLWQRAPDVLLQEPLPDAGWNKHDDAR